MTQITELFGSMVFNDCRMKRLPKDTQTLKNRRSKTGKALDSTVANVVASAMKDWAIKRAPRTLRIGSNP